MSYYAIIDDRVADKIATTRGYSDLGKWIDTLSVEDHGELIHVREHGWSQQVMSLIQQLGKALRDAPPTNNSVLTTARGLLKTIRDAKPTADSVLVISDGADGELPGDDTPKDDWSQY
jgi:hypothetical protein